MNQNKVTPYIPTLDGWRGIAILCVIACHSTGFLFSPTESHVSIIHQILLKGSLGVDIFFGISGFLICTRILDNETIDGSIHIGTFYLRRISRIFPAYFAYLSVLAIMTVYHWLPVLPKALLSCAFFLQNYNLTEKEVSWFIGHFWTLAVEEHFYLIFPSALILMGINNKRRIGALFICALTISLWRVFEFRFQLLERLLPNIGFFGRTDIRLDGLILGALAAISLKTPVYFNKLRTFLYPWWSRVLVFLFFILFSAINFPLAMLWRSILIPSMLLATILNPASLFSKFLETSALRWVGRLSYSLYIWNNFFLVPTQVSHIPHYESIQYPPLNYVALFLVSIASYYLIERPIMQLGHRISGG